MNRLAIAHGLRSDATIGDAGGLFGNILSTVQADTRAELYQQLADFQAIPSRIVRVTNQLNAFAIAAPQRSIDESAQLTAIQAGLNVLQGQWSSTNDTVNRTISSISGGSSALAAAGDVAQSIAGMTLIGQAINALEQQARSLVSSSPSLTDDQRQMVLAQGAPYALDIVTIVKYAAGAYVGYRLLKALKIL